MANFQKKFVPFLFCTKKIFEFTTEISFCEFGKNSAKKKEGRFFKVRRVGSQVHQKLFKSARILSGEKILKLGTPIEIATWRQQDQAILGALVWPMLP